MERLLDRGSCAFTHPLIAAAVREALGRSTRCRSACARRGPAGRRGRSRRARGRAPRSRGAERGCRRRRDTASCRRGGAAPRGVRDRRTAALARAGRTAAARAEVDAVDFERGRALLDAGDGEGVGVLTRVARRAADVSVRVDAARVAASGLRFRGQREEAVALLRGVLDTLSDSDRERRLELLVEVTMIGGSSAAGLPDARRTIAAEAATATGEYACRAARDGRGGAAARRAPFRSGARRAARCLPGACTATIPADSRPAASPSARPRC